MMQTNTIFWFGMGVVGGLLLTSCRSIPRNAQPVKDFNPEKYLVNGTRLPGSITGSRKI